ncbi:hypothetical protein J6590_030269 [Homalodisca vitripennis]|nr:hypothetical protein J6590_030269 [Homalodisca vitripennis]
MEEQLDRRHEINTATKRTVLSDLQCFLDEHHALIRLFKTALERLPSDDYKVMIRADKRHVAMQGICKKYMKHIDRMMHCNIH